MLFRTRRLAAPFLFSLLSLAAIPLSAHAPSIVLCSATGCTCLLGPNLYFQCRPYVASQYFNFVSTPGGPNPASQTLILRNGTHGLMPWTATVTKGAEWLAVSPGSGSIACGTDADPSAPCADRDLVNLTISVSSTSLAAGVYYGTITISAPGSVSPFSPPADNTPQVVEVALTISASGQAAPGIGLSPTALEFGDTTGSGR